MLFRDFLRIFLNVVVYVQKRVAIAVDVEFVDGFCGNVRVVEVEVPGVSDGVTERFGVAAAEEPAV